MKEYIFDAKILKHAHIDAAFIEFPYNVERKFGVHEPVKVKATFEVGIPMIICSSYFNSGSAR